VAAPIGPPKTTEGKTPKKLKSGSRSLFAVCGDRRHFRSTFSHSFPQGKQGPQTPHLAVWDDDFWGPVFFRTGACIAFNSFLDHSPPNGRQSRRPATALT